MTLTAMIDAGTGSGATGALQQLTPNLPGQGFGLQAGNAGLSADFRSGWQQILSGLADQSPVNETQQPSIQSFMQPLPAGTPAPDAIPVMQQPVGRLPVKSNDETEKSTVSASASTASRNAPAVRESRKGHSDRADRGTHFRTGNLMASMDQSVSVAASSASIADHPAAGLHPITLTVALPSAGLPFTESRHAPRATQSNSEAGESETKTLLPMEDLVPEGVAPVSINESTSLSLHSQEPTTEKRFAAAREAVSSEISPDQSSKPLTANPSHTAQLRNSGLPVAVKASFPDTPLQHVDRDAPPLPSSEAAVAVDTPSQNNSEHAHLQRNAAQPAKTTVAETTAAPRAFHTTPSEPQPRAQRTGTASRPDGTALSSAENAGAAQPKHFERIPAKAVATAHPSGGALQPAFNAHSASSAGTATAPVSLVTPKSDLINDPRARAATETQSPVKTSAPDAFAALDAHGASPAVTWIQAGTHRAEAGYLDPSLGWVSVRAQADGSSLHASIIPGSGEAAQALGGHLTGLTSFMAERHGLSSTVTIASPGQGSSQNEFHHSGEAPAQQQPRENQQRESTATSPSQLATSDRAPAQPRSNPEISIPYARHGAHISVIA